MLNETDIQVFKSTFFHYSPIEHEFVPKHTLLTPVEKSDLLRKVPAHQLPKIMKDDVIAMFYGAQVGDVFKIERSKNVYYRIVSHSVVQLRANRKVALDGHRRKPTSRLLVKVVKKGDNAEIATYATSLRRNNTT